SGDSERALSRLVSFASTRPAHFSVWRLLARDEHQRNVRLLAELFSLNESLSQGLIGFPHTQGRAEDASFTFLADASLDSPPSATQIQAHFEDEMAKVRPDATVEEFDATMNHARHRILSQIALHDLAHQPDAAEIGIRLSDLADEVLRRMLRDLAARNLVPLRRSGCRFDLAILALGKLGMRFMDFGSDLDLVFVFRPVDAEGASTEQLREHATRVGVQMMSRLRSRAGGARLYDVDTRLRPSGRQGLLVSSGEAFTRYQRGALPVWERLASLWIRPIFAARFGDDTADATDREAIMDWAARLASDTRSALVAAQLPPAQVAAETAKILQRVFHENSRESRTARLPVDNMRTLLEQIGAGAAPQVVLDAKLAPGSCLDLELGVGALLLSHSTTLAQLDSTSPSHLSSVLDALDNSGAIRPSEAEDLRSAYAFLRKLLNRLRMDAHKLGDDSADSFSTHSPRLPRVARRMGIEDETALLRQFLEHRIAVRSILNARSLPR
ncbi:MAG: hypothetical protein ACPHRO_07310, partial [Nannocystaceae bacterium]